MLKTIRNMGDKELVELINHNFKASYADKKADNERGQRYLHIFKALDNPDDIIEEDTAELSDDRRIYSNTYMPIGAAIAETAISAAYNSIFPSPDYFEIDPADPRDQLATQRITAHMMKRHKENRFRHFVYRCLQQATCFDYGVSMATWELKGGYIPKKTEKVIHQQFGPISLPKREISIENEWVPDAIDRSNNIVLNYFNCYHDAAAQNGLIDSEYFIDIRWELLENLQENALSEDNPYGRYKNVDHLETLVAAEIGVPADETAGISDLEAQVKRQRVKIVRYWTKDHVAEMAGGKIIHRMHLTEWPLTIWKIHYIPNRFEGMGIIQRIERMQYDINAIVNVKRDFQNLILNPISMMDEELASLNDNKMELYPGRTIITPSGRNPKDMMSFYQPGVDMSQGATEELGLQMDNAKEMSGISDNMMSNFSRGRKTARETSAVAAGAFGKILTIASRLEETCLEPIYRHQFLLEQRYLSKKAQFKYHGEHSVDWVVVTPDDYKFSAVPSFIAKGTTVYADKESRVQQFMAGLSYAVQFPQYHDLQVIFTELWKHMAPKDYQRFVKNPELDRAPNIPPELENELFMQGKWATVLPNNDDDHHLSVHGALMQTADFRSWPERLRNNLLEHNKDHEGSKQLKLQQNQAPTQIGSGPPTNVQQPGDGGQAGVALQ